MRVNASRVAVAGGGGEVVVIRTPASRILHDTVSGTSFMLIAHEQGSVSSEVACERIRRQSDQSCAEVSAVG